MTLRKHTNTLLLSLLALVGFMLSGCTTGDDIEEIFVGHTWYMTGAKINGQKLNTDVKIFYQVKNTYFLSFANNNVECVLSASNNIRGTWLANGNRHEISLNLSQKLPSENNFDRSLYNILCQVKTYKGDSNVVTLYADKDNTITFSSQR